MPLECSSDILGAIKAIEDDKKYGIWMLKILYCNAHVEKSFKKADCWTIAYHTYNQVVEKYGEGDENFKVTLQHKKLYADEIRKIRASRKKFLLAHPDKPIPNDPIYKLPLNRIHGICTLFDIKLIKEISLQMDEDEAKRVKEELKTRWKKENAQKRAIELLHNFIRASKNFGVDNPIFESRFLSSETEWCSLLTVHLLEPLTHSPICLESHYSNKGLKRCPCPCERKVKYGDTSIGNKEVWHGSPDALLGPVGVTFTMQPIDKNVKENSILGFKLLRSAEDDDDEDDSKVPFDTRSQCLSQTITFACCKRDNEPSLVPHILIAGKYIQIFMYDCNYDILLESSILSLVDDTNDGSLDLNTVLILWLALHWTLFSTGPTNHMYDANFKSGFISMMKEKGVLEMYLKNMNIAKESRCFYGSRILDLPDTGSLERFDEKDVQPLLKRQASTDSSGSDSKRQKPKTGT